MERRDAIDRAGRLADYVEETGSFADVLDVPLVPETIPNPAFTKRAFLVQLLRELAAQPRVLPRPPRSNPELWVFVNLAVRKCGNYTGREIMYFHEAVVEAALNRCYYYDIGNTDYDVDTSEWKLKTIDEEVFGYDGEVRNRDEMRVVDFAIGQDLLEHAKTFAEALPPQLDADFIKTNFTPCVLEAKKHLLELYKERKTRYDEEDIENAEEDLVRGKLSEWIARIKEELGPSTKEELGPKTKRVKK